jgi:hypothetical protein
MNHSTHAVGEGWRFVVISFTTCRLLVVRGGSRCGLRGRTRNFLVLVVVSFGSVQRRHPTYSQPLAVIGFRGEVTIFLVLRLHGFSLVAVILLNSWRGGTVRGSKSVFANADGSIDFARSRYGSASLR